MFCIGNISFIFDELEDFTVTATIKNKSVIEALYEVIGFYPIRVTHVDGNIYLECWQKEPNRMKGRLLDENMHPVEYANVQLFNPADTTFITGGVSNANGDFVIPVDAKEVLLKTHCIGYMPYSKVYEVGSIGTVRIHTNAKLLRELKVEQRQVEYNGDKIIAYPTSTQIQHSYDFFSLLNQQPFPGLFVDEFNRSISVFSGSPVILVDGVKKTTRDLLLIQPKNIKRIEYSMNVPMKYANSGASGVIYIYLKDPKAAGGSFYSSVQSALTTGFVNADAGASYNQGKSQFTFDYGLNYRNYNERVIDLEESYVGDDFRVDLKEKGGESPFGYSKHLLDAGYNYRHDKTMYFSAKFRNQFFVSDYKELGYIEDSYAGNYNRTSYNKIHLYTPSLDLYMQKEWDGGHTFEVQVVGALSDRSYDRVYDDVYDDGKVQSYPSKVSTDYRSLVSEVSYKKSFGRNTALSAGLQNEISKSENNYELDDYTTALKSNDNYAYISFNQQIGRMSLNVGTGLKYIKMQSERNEREFARNISTLSFSGSPLSKLYISYTASYKPIIPSLSNLTVLEQTSNNYISVTGNPELKVGHATVNRLALATDIKKKVGIVLVNTLSYNRDQIYNTLTYKGDGKFLKKAMNYDSWMHYEARLVLTLNEVFNKHLSARLETHYHRYQSKGDGLNHSLNSVGVNFNVTGYFGKWMAQVSCRVPYKVLGAETLKKTEPWSTLTLGYRHKNWFLMLSGNNLFSSVGTKYPEWNLSAVNPSYVYTYIKDNANMVTISVRYNVTFGKLFGKTKKRTLHNSDSGLAVINL